MRDLEVISLRRDVENFSKNIFCPNETTHRKEAKKGIREKRVERRWAAQRRANTITLYRHRRLERGSTIFRWLSPPHLPSSPSYNLLVNFASLLEGYVRWDKKYPEREREREWYPPLATTVSASLSLPLRSCRCYCHRLPCVITILRLCCVHQHRQHCAGTSGHQH